MYVIVRRTIETVSRRFCDRRRDMTSRSYTVFFPTAFLFLFFFPHSFFALFSRRSLRGTRRAAYGNNSNIIWTPSGTELGFIAQLYIHIWWRIDHAFQCQTTHIRILCVRTLYFHIYMYYYKYVKRAHRYCVRFRTRSGDVTNVRGRPRSEDESDRDDLCVYWDR